MKRLGLALVAAMLASAQPAASDEGRYTIHDATIMATTDSVDNLPRGTVLLDTVTGRTWAGTIRHMKASGAVRGSIRLANSLGIAGAHPGSPDGF